MKRIVELDIIKALAIIMVVIGHTSCPSLIGQMFYLIHVPLFYMVSGYTCKDDSNFYSVESLRHFFVKRISSLYIPFLKYVLPIVLCHNILYSIGVYNVHFTFKDYSFQACRTLLMSIGNEEPLLRQMWFLKVLLLTEIYYSFIVYISNKICVPKYYILGSIYLVVFFIDSSSLNHVYIMNIYLPFKAMLYYNVGNIVKNYFPISTIKKRIIPVILFSGVWILSAYFIRTSFQESSHSTAIYQLLLTLSAFYAISAFPFLILPMYIQRKLQNLGGRTMIIFCWHYAVFLLISIIYVLLKGEELNVLRDNCRIINVPWWCFSFCGILIPYFLYRLKYVVIH